MPEQTKQTYLLTGGTGRLRWAVLLVLALLLLALFWPGAWRDQRLQAAPAKGGEPLDLNQIAGLALNQQSAAALALADARVQALLKGQGYSFLGAVRLGQGESAAWHDDGCGRRNCAHVMLYNNQERAMVEAIVHLEQERVLAQWSDAEARPGASAAVFFQAVEIAALNPAVQEVLGDIRESSPVMLPMPIWLADNACARDWCVDLTYMDPAGSGRVFHVVVNLDREELVRTFFSRSRPDRAFKRPAQEQPFEDGCHEQHDWHVCWEMTGSDGLNFYDVTYDDRPLLNGVKIGQVEVWYPAWPGGYRDEIGFQATVAPQFGTHVNELDDGFEVRQLFTEFLHWPNCICCYRYEQIMRFYADGAFEFSIVSHGPGCEDLSHYRPFWRIELAEEAGDMLWLWGGDSWNETPQETELALFDNLGPGGQRLAVGSEEQSYRWLPETTDPLGLDEGRLFVLRTRGGEGDGPIPTGPADTFQPPRQWLDKEELAGNNLVVWYVPIMQTKRGGPWWCTPDPEPEFSPCEAILRVEPAGPVTEPTAAELATVPTPLPAVDAPAQTGEMVVRPIPGDDPLTIIEGAGCGSCHQIGDMGEVGKVGPDLTFIGLLASSRVPGMSAEEYIAQSITEPNLYLAPECPNGDCLSNVMPQDYSQRMSAEQIEMVVEYLIALGYAAAQGVLEEVPTPEPEAEATVTAGAEPSPTAGATAEADRPERPGNNVSGETIVAINLMVVGILLLLGLAAIARRSS